MHAVEAMLIIARAKRKKTKLIGMDYHFVRNSGLKLYSITKDADGNPVFCKVEKEAFIKWMEETHNLHKKRTSIRNVLRNSSRES